MRPFGEVRVSDTHPAFQIARELFLLTSGDDWLPVVLDKGGQVRYDIKSRQEFAHEALLRGMGWEAMDFGGEDEAYEDARYWLKLLKEQVEAAKRLPDVEKNYGV